VPEDPRGRLGRRLRRILLLLPYAIRNPGVSVQELSERFEVSKRDLLDDLNLLFFCGVPGYGPGDLIDVSIEQDSVFVSMADYFSAPLRLTPAEGLSLYSGAAAIAELPGMEQADALKRALEKLGRVLRADAASGTPDAAPIQVKLERTQDVHLETLQEAVRAEKQVHLEYLSASRGELTERTLDPWGLIAALGRWYLVGLAHLSGEERMFRIDRIKSATVMDERAEIPEDLDPERYRGAFLGGGSMTLRFEISPVLARWFEDYYPVLGAETLADGWRRVELGIGAPRWGAMLLLRLGGDVRAVDPPTIEDEARTLAAAIAARYPDVSPRT